MAKMKRRNIVSKADWRAMATAVGENALTRFSLVLFMFLSLINCKGQGNSAANYSAAEPLPVHRFDQAFLTLLESPDTEKIAAFQAEYAPMIRVLERSLFKTATTDSAEVDMDRLLNYFSEPTLLQLYKATENTFADVSSIEQSLASGFEFLKAELPDLQVPAIYLHVSGLNQNVLVADSLLSISIDKYLGADFPLYQDFFYDYQLRRMQASAVVPDYFTAWLYAEYPFEGKEEVLLERMIYEGKIKYLVQLSVPSVSEEELFGFTSEELAWCKANESGIWKSIVEKKHLYTPDVLTTLKYFEGQPSVFISEEAPGNLGPWVGYQIVKKEIERTKSSLAALMQNNNAQDILTQSRYKP